LSSAIVHGVSAVQQQVEKEDDGRQPLQISMRDPDLAPWAACQWTSSCIPHTTYWSGLRPVSVLPSPNPPPLPPGPDRQPEGDCICTCICSGVSAPAMGPGSCRNHCKPMSSERLTHGPRARSVALHLSTLPPLSRAMPHPVRFWSALGGAALSGRVHCNTTDTMVPTHAHWQGRTGQDRAEQDRQAGHARALPRYLH